MPRLGDRRRRLMRVCVVALGGVLAGVVGGCGPQSHEAGPPSMVATTVAPSIDPAPSPTPSSIYAAPADAYVKPTRPAILDGKPSEDAAIAFARFYLRMYTYAYLTGDAAGLNALGRAGCVYCKNVADDLAREYGAGGHDEGGAITVLTSRAHDYGLDGIYGVWLTARQAPNREVDAEGAAVAAYPTPSTDSYEFALYWDSEHGWRLGDLTVSAQ